jgi:poly(3-hydroxybutyrate) depolymerase
MSGNIIVNGLNREFAFFEPVGWERAVERLVNQENYAGLPLVIALHAGAADPATFAANWPFYQLVRDPGANLADLFFVVYPYAYAYGGDTPSTPAPRCWNFEYSAHFWPNINDVAFIVALEEMLEAWLLARLEASGIEATTAFDPDRKYLFGISAGGMMAQRLQHERSSKYAAIWVQSASFGGRTHMDEDLAEDVLHPPYGVAGISLFHHHGLEDVNVVPGDDQDDDVVMQSVVSTNTFITYGGLNQTNADRYARGDFSVETELDDYRDYNGTEFLSTLTSQPSVEGNDSTHYKWRIDCETENPIVEYYADPDMNHSNFQTMETPYFDETDVWAWFKAHPRVIL